jgi:CBS domain-containing protein
MIVAELMQTDVRTIHPEAGLSEVVTELSDGHVSALAVMDGRQRLVGVVTTTDLLEAQADARDDEAWTAVLVREVMSHPALTIAPEADVREAAQQMLYGEVHRLFVTDREQLVGVISQTDIVRAYGAGRLGR